MSSDVESDFEATVAVLLAERANRAVVEADALGPTANDPRHSAGAGGPTRWWLAVAAVLVIAGGAGLTLRDAGPRPDPLVGVSSPESGPATRASDVVVWMEVGVEAAAVRDLAALLASSALVQDVVYVDQAATWSEFVAHFADDPDTIGLVRPEDLPTSFKVRTGAPGPVIALVSDRAGVEEIEVLALEE